jgi:hypothetical protein
MKMHGLANHKTNINYIGTYAELEHMHNKNRLCVLFTTVFPSKCLGGLKYGALQTAVSSHIRISDYSVVFAEQAWKTQRFYSRIKATCISGEVKYLFTIFCIICRKCLR